MPQGGFGNTPFGGINGGGSVSANAYTAQNIISSAYRKLLVPNPSTTQLSNGLDALNDMLASWFTQRLHINELVIENFPLQANLAVYRIGDDSQYDFNTTRPIKIVSAYLRLNDIDFPLNIGVLKEYDDMTIKNTVSTPMNLYYIQEFPAGAILLDPIPDQAYQLYIDSWKPLIFLDDLATVVNMPPENNRALIYNLALELSDEVNQNPSASIVAIAGQSLDWITHVNGSAAPEAKFDAAISNGGWRSNILSGE